MAFTFFYTKLRNMELSVSRKNNQINAFVINLLMEQKFLINGGRKLSGEIYVGGAKNSFLPIMCACALAEGEFCLKNYVNLLDIDAMCEILGVLNCKTVVSSGELYVNSKNIKNTKITYDLTQKLRASIILLGALLSKFRFAEIAYPGGCNIGTRPIDIHLSGLREFGVKIVEKHGYIYCFGENMHCANVVLPFQSVGATESLMMAAVLLDGTSTIKNVAKEPEVVDLQNFLNKMGAKVSGAGTDEITIVGVKKLHGCEHFVMSDRIVAGTYLLATAICGGEVAVLGSPASHNESLLNFLSQTACKIDAQGDKIILRADKRLLSIPHIMTRPFPFFPTDLQSPMLVLQAVSDGVSLIEETLFENRFQMACELKKMNAQISVNGRTALVKGVEKLYGADVFASDLRSGAGLVLAGLKAEGYTTVHNIEYIDRGYEKLEEKFSLLGADMTRV